MPTFSIRLIEGPRSGDRIVITRETSRHLKEIRDRITAAGEFNGYRCEVITDTPPADAFDFTTPGGIIDAAEAFAAQVGHYDPFATQQKCDIVKALQTATPAAVLRFAAALRRFDNPHAPVTRSDVMLHNITRTLES